MAQAAWIAQVSQIFAKQGVPAPIWEAIMYDESQGNPAATNLLDPNGGSFGLFQLNRGGQGKGLTLKQLTNPIVNAKVAAPPISAAYKQALKYGYTGSLAAIYTATHSGHPGTAPPGKLLPPKGSRGYAAFAKEANGIAMQYDRITKVWRPATLPGTGGLTYSGPELVNGQVITTGGAPRLSPPTKPSYGTWGTVLTDLNAATNMKQALSVGWTHPGKLLGGLVTFIAFLVLALIMVVVGLNTVVNSG